MILGVHIPIGSGITVGQQAKLAVCSRCWSGHDEVLLVLSAGAVGWSCTAEEERAHYADFFRSAVPDAVPAANHLASDVREWFDSKPAAAGMNKAQRSAYLLYRMGAIPPAAAPYCTSVQAPPKPLGAVGVRVKDVEVTCVAVIDQPATQWGPAFLIQFDCLGHRLHWRAGTGGLDAKAGGVYRASFTIKSFETFGGDPIVMVNRVQDADYKPRRKTAEPEENNNAED